MWSRTGLFCLLHVCILEDCSIAVFREPSWVWRHKMLTIPEVKKHRKPNTTLSYTYTVHKCPLSINNLRGLTLLRLNHFPLSLASSHQGPVPCSHGHVMAPWGIHLCSLPFLPGREWICGREGPSVLRMLLWAVLCSHLRPLPAKDSGGEL